MKTKREQQKRRAPFGKGRIEKAETNAQRALRLRGERASADPEYARVNAAMRQREADYAAERQIRWNKGDGTNYEETIGARQMNTTSGSCAEEVMRIAMGGNRGPHGEGGAPPSFSLISTLFRYHNSTWCKSVYSRNIKAAASF